MDTRVRLGPLNWSGSSAKRPAAAINFRKSPFYDIQEPVTRAVELPSGFPVLHSMMIKAEFETDRRVVLPQNRQTIEEYLTLNPQMVDRLISDPSLRLMLYCASEPMLGPYSSTDISFPHQIDIRVNSNEIKANTRGLKNRPGSTRPVDITDSIRIQTQYRNTIAIMYALTQKVC
jgi:E3 SUMO-protein ligase PIAS1